jgi:hypothetical protein
MVLPSINSRDLVRDAYSRSDGPALYSQAYFIRKLGVTVVAPGVLWPS